MKVIEKILTGDDGESLRKCILKLEAENSWLTTAIAEPSETITRLQCSLHDGVEDYNLLMADNESLLAEHSDM
jgi:hypothetical protein